MFDDYLIDNDDLNNNSNIIKYIQKTKNFDHIIQNTNIDITEYIDLNLIEIYFDKILWKVLHKNRYIKKEFILKHKDKEWDIYGLISKNILSFEELSRFKEIDNYVIDKYYKKNWDWEYLIINTNIVFLKNSCKLELVEKYMNRFYFNYLIDNPYIDDKFILKNKDKNWDIRGIITKNIMLFEELSILKNINTYIINDYYDENWNWEYLLINTDIIFFFNSCPRELIDKYPNRFNWYFMDKNKNINRKFILKHKDKNWNIYELIEKNILIFKELSRLKNVINNVNIIILINNYYLHAWDWEYLIKNTITVFKKNSAPLKLIEKYPYRFNWKYMHFNPNITRKFVFKFMYCKNWNIYKLIKMGILLFEDMYDYTTIKKEFISYYYLQEWDWEYLLTNIDIIFEKNSCPLEIINEYPDRFNWNYMTYNPHIDDKFILKHKDKKWDINKLISKNILTFEELSRFKEIDSSIINKYYNQKWNWEYLLINTDIVFEFNSCPLELINKYPDKFDWYYILHNPNINEEFILKHTNKYFNAYKLISFNYFTFKQLSKFKCIDENVILKYFLKNWDWEYLLMNTNIVFLKNSCKLELIEKYPYRFHWKYMNNNPHIDEDFILKHIDKEWDVCELVNKFIFPIEKLYKFKNFHKYINKYFLKNWNWEYLLMNTNIIFEKNSCPLELIEKYPNRFNDIYISYNPYITTKFIIDNYISK